MQISFDIAITNDLEVGFFMRDGSSELTDQQAKAVLEKLVELLGQQITLTNVLPVEKHSDDGRLQAVHDLTHAHNHNHS